MMEWLMNMKHLVEQELTRKTEVFRETCPSTALPTANLTWLDLWSNPSWSGGGNGDSSHGDSPSIRSVLQNGALQKIVHMQNAILWEKTLGNSVTFFCFENWAQGYKNNMIHEYPVCHKWRIVDKMVNTWDAPLSDLPQENQAQGTPKASWHTLINVSHVMKNFIGNNTRLINNAVLFIGLLFLVKQRFTSWFSLP
jgi:hypothetical protein